MAAAWCIYGSRVWTFRNLILDDALDHTNLELFHPIVFALLCFHIPRAIFTKATKSLLSVMIRHVKGRQELSSFSRAYAGREWGSRALKYIFEIHFSKMSFMTRANTPGERQIAR